MGDKRKMTKEELDAEVYEYAKSRIGTEDNRMTDRMLAYRAGAEPREKRIAELEKQVEKGRNIVHKLLVIIQRHKWWDYTVIDEARAFMSEVDHDKDHD